MSGYSIHLEGSTAIEALASVVKRLEHPLPLFDEIGRMLTVSTQQRFETGIDPDGNPWPKSLRATLTGGRTMVDTTRLVSSITHIADETGVEVGSAVIYAGVHQRGDTIRAKNAPFLHFKHGEGWAKVTSVTMPRRAFLGLDDDDERAIIDIAGDFLTAPLGAGETVDG